MRSAHSLAPINSGTLPAPPRRAHGWLLLALLAAVLTITYGMGTLPLIQPDEGRNAEVAREMKVSGAWLVPTYNGLTYLDKPAFYFKAVALSLAAFGDNEFAARLPSALFAFAVLALLWNFTRREAGDRVAALAVLVVATLPLFISQARIVIFDIALALFVCTAILAGYQAEATEGTARRRWYLLGAAATGIATLVKGPVGFLIPLLVLVPFNLVERQKGALRRLFHPFNVLVFLAIVLPWFIGTSLLERDFPHYGLVEESFNRFTTKKFRRTQPFYFYFWVLPATFFPWSLMLPEAAFALRRQWRSLPRISRLAVVWGVAVVGFFSLSQSKLPGYILSVSLPFGILVAQLLDAALTNPAGRAARMVKHAVVTLVVFSALLAAVLIIVAPQNNFLANPIAIKGVDIPQFSPFLITVVTLLGLVTLAGSVAWFRRSVRAATVSFALVPVLLVVMGSGIFLTVNEGRSARRMAAQLPPLSPETELVFYQCLPNGLPFYLRRTGTLVTADGGETSSNYVQYALRRHAIWPDTVIPPDNFDAWLANRRGPVYLIAREHERPRLEALAARLGTTVKELPQRYLGVLLPAPKGV